MIVKEIERAGIPIVQVCNMVPVANSVGVKRLFASKSIKYPFGFPELDKEGEVKKRTEMLEQALDELK